MLSWASVLDDDTLTQAARSAQLAVVDGHVALMPDAHVGHGATVGSVIPTREAIIPSAVGVDIGCGVQAVKTTLTADDLPDSLDGLLDGFSRRIPAGVGQGHAAVRDRAWAAFVAAHGEPEGDDTVRRKAALQHGTLGSGNHFLEVCLDETDTVWLMLHSGSRGVGNMMAGRHMKVARALAERGALGKLPDRALAWLTEGTAEFDAYIRDLTWAQAYAAANREAMIAIALTELAAQMKRGADSDPWELVRASINNHHNYAAKERHFGHDVWVTRKGAIRARTGELGVIPGSMGTGSFIVRGLGQPDSYMSAAHGAGRAMSRSEAKRRYTAADLERAMEGRTWLRAKAKSLIDEIPGSYKDLDTVMADQHDLVEVVHRLTTLVNYKGT